MGLWFFLPSLLAVDETGGDEVASRFIPRVVTRAFEREVEEIVVSAAVRFIHQSGARSGIARKNFHFHAVRLKSIRDFVDGLFEIRRRAAASNADGGILR